METRQVLLISLQPLLSEGLKRILQQLEDLELVQLSGSNLPALEAILHRGQPDVIVVAGENGGQIKRLISVLLNRCAEVPIIWVGLDDSQLHIISSHVLPGSRTGLVDTIRKVAADNPKRKSTLIDPSGGDTNAV